jgi:hypothetical protein
LLVDPGFDLGAAAWAQNTNSSDPLLTNVKDIDSSLPPYKAQSGAYFMWMGGFSDGIESLHQAVTLPSSFSGGQFSFYYQIETEESANDPTDPDYDVFSVEIIDGTSESNPILATVSAFSNKNFTTVGDDPSLDNWNWVTYAVPSSWAGKTIIIRFSDTTDGSLKTSMFVDTVRLCVN